MKKLLFILIGPKGSGKTYIGSKIEQLTDIKFLPVEPLWLQLAEGENGWAKVEHEIDRLFLQHDKVVIESLGAGDGFNGLHASLKEKYDIKLIKVETDLDECLRRVRERDSADHIPVSDEKVREYNRIAAGVEYPWDAVIDNNGPATDEEILRKCLKSHGLANLRSIKRIIAM
jgi:shikimate kinase